uniref:Ig-like domain-containing protein n=1 Tax=Stomoxys calcitrans TaxID=35570 RepID=A0A1I8NTJ3_STOCA
MKINVMYESESESELQPKRTTNSNASICTSITRLCSRHEASTQLKAEKAGNRLYSKSQRSIRTRAHRKLQNEQLPAGLTAASTSPASPTPLTHSRKMKRKCNIPEISWLIVAICLNCYVIFSSASASVSAAEKSPYTTSSSTYTSASIKSTVSAFSTASSSELILPLSEVQFTTLQPTVNAFTKLTNSTSLSATVAAMATSTHLSSNATSAGVSTEQRRRPKRGTHSSPDGRHIDVDVDNDDDMDVDDMHGHLQHGHHGDLVDADDMYLHNIDNIGYHHDGTGLLPHELPEHDHIAHHLEMQTHEELLEDIRDDTGVNIIPDKDLPKFGEPLQNVTVPVGREAVLQCVVDNLQTYKIAWLRVDTQTILTIQNHVITKNHRMSITHAEKRAWILRIRDVKESDKGWYMCQINTDPMKSQVGYLDVVVPPDILDYPTSTDMVVREGSNVTLKCAATGSPTPTITWRREGGEPIPIPNGTEAISFNGSFLTIAKVKRLNMGAYLCIASNGIPPSVSKRVMLIIHFPPMIWIQNQLVGAAIGQNITLECQSEAFPKSINYWMKNDTIIVPGERFVPETYESGYKITMRLTINDVDAQDFGSYRCVAKNSLGDTDGAIKLYHIPQTTTVTTLAPTVSTNTVPMLVTKYHKEQRYNFQQNNNNNNKNGNNGSNNYNHKVQQRTKSKMDFPQQQNNVYLGATSTMWNTQQQQQQHQQDRYVVRGEQYQGPDHPNYRGNFDSKNLQHDANSLSLENNEVYSGSGKKMVGTLLHLMTASIMGHLTHYVFQQIITWVQAPLAPTYLAVV